MATGDLITRDSQFEIRGLLMGRGTNYLITEGSISGLGTPDIYASEEALGRDHGSVGGREFAGGRKISFPVAIRATSRAQLETNLAALREAWKPAEASGDIEVEAAWQLGGTKFMVRGRPRGASGLDLDGMPLFFARAECAFAAFDPRIFAITEDLETITIGAAGSTRGYPAGYVKSYTGASDTSDTIVNDGAADTFPEITITGQCTGPKIADDAGNYLSLPFLEVGSGETLTVDCRQRTIDLDGTDYRWRMTSASEWLSLPSGTSRTFTLSVQSWTASTSAAIRWRDANV